MDVRYTYHMDIKDLIKKAGGPKSVGDACGISSQAVSQWTKVPSVHVMKIANLLTGTGITKEKIRPDIFCEQPELAQSA